MRLHVRVCACVCACVRASANKALPFTLKLHYLYELKKITGNESLRTASNTISCCKRMKCFMRVVEYLGIDREGIQTTKLMDSR